MILNLFSEKNMINFYGIGTYKWKEFNTVTLKLHQFSTY